MSPFNDLMLIQSEKEDDRTTTCRMCKDDGCVDSLGKNSEMYVYLSEELGI